MNISKEVIKDLLPLYVSGEASDETCRLVETAVADDAELAKALREMTEAEHVLRPVVHVPDLDRAEARSLARARSTVRYRSGVLGAAIAYTLLPFSFVYSGGEFKWLVLSYAPGAATASFAIAAILWAAYAYLAFKARHFGL